MLISIQQILRNIGNNRFADDIVNTMKSAGYDVRETDPFSEKITFSFDAREVSPYANRIRLLWNLVFAQF